MRPSRTEPDLALARRRWRRSQGGFDPAGLHRRVSGQDKHDTVARARPKGRTRV
ncbi:MAG: hypothetical protein LBD01_01285 [Puniceicoccales bacterium]|nr:hypothetical protein [Puniceicoccales bacterium]